MRIEEVGIYVLFIFLILLFCIELSCLLDYVPLDAVFVEDHILVGSLVHLIKGGYYEVEFTV